MPMSLGRGVLDIIIFQMEECTVTLVRISRDTGLLAAIAINGERRGAAGVEVGGGGSDTFGLLS